MDWNKYKITCGECACYFSCMKAKEANQDVCNDFIEPEDEDSE